MDRFVRLRRQPAARRALLPGDPPLLAGAARRCAASRLRGRASEDHRARRARCGFPYRRSARPRRRRGSEPLRYRVTWADRLAGARQRGSVTNRMSWQPSRAPSSACAHCLDLNGELHGHVEAVLIAEGNAVVGTVERPRGIRTAMLLLVLRVGLAEKLVDSERERMGYAVQGELADHFGRYATLEIRQLSL